MNLGPIHVLKLNLKKHHRIMIHSSLRSESKCWSGTAAVTGVDGTIFNYYLKVESTDPIIGFI